MAAKGYTDKISIENYTLQNIDNNFSSQITAWIEAIERYIENQTGRVFIADQDSSKRLYDGDGTCEVYTDDFISIDILEVGNELPYNTIDSDDYFLYPANSEYKNSILLKSSIFSSGHQNIRVTAKWGYSLQVPADIHLAATILVAGITNKSDGSKSKVRSETVGRYSVTYADEKGWADFDNAVKVIESYKKYSC